MLYWLTYLVPDKAWLARSMSYGLYPATLSSISGTAIEPEAEFEAHGL